MAKTARKHRRPAGGLPELTSRIAARLNAEPPAGIGTALVAVLAAGLYLAGLDYPLVFGDFVALTPARLEAYVRAAPVPGAEWLADASFGWWWQLAGTDWAWHRGLNLTLHLVAVLVAFALFRRICAQVDAVAARPIAGGWIALLAAGLFALHPVAVHSVAYLSARASMLAGMWALVALWSVARGLQDAWRGAWLIGPLACAAAQASSPGAIAVPVAMAWLAFMLPQRAAGGQRIAWIGVGISAAVAVGYGVVLALAAPPAAEAAATTGYLDSLAAASTRFVRYLGFWWLPLTRWMAADMPEAVISARAAWPGWLGILLFVGLIAAAVLTRRRSALLRCAGTGLGCALALYAAQWLWPRIDAPFALMRSYAWMPCTCLALACGIAYLPVRAAAALACVLMLAWLVLAAGTLQTFSSHMALWDDAVRRAQITGPRAEDARIYLNRATLHRREGHLIAALADYDKAVELRPDLVRALRARAQLHISEGRYGDALRDLDRVQALEPAQAITHADRGLVLMQAGRLAEAGKAFDTAIERGAKEPRVFLNRGLARFQLGGLAAAPAALTDIERALELDPGYALAYFNRAILFEQAARANIRLRDAASPELMRAVAAQNLARACQLGHAPACERAQARSAQSQLPGVDPGALRMTPESLRQQGLPVR